MIAWTSPRTWVSGEIISAAIMNTHVRDNLLQTAPNGVSAVTITRTAALTTTLTTASASMADMTGFTTSVVTRGGWLNIRLLTADAAGAEPYFNHSVAGSTISLQAIAGATTLPFLTVMRPIAGSLFMVPLTVFEWWSKPAAATITVKLQWATSAATGTFTLTSTGGAVLQVVEYISS